jgi:hypothetical protein
MSASRQGKSGNASLRTAVVGRLGHGVTCQHAVLKHEPALHEDERWRQMSASRQCKSGNA